VKSTCSSRFWKCYQALPGEIRELADKNYQLWRDNLRRHSLQYKMLCEGLWSVRVGAHYRALAHLDGDEVMWVWIGHHSEYDHLI
jgi:hypothetical protein